MERAVIRPNGTALSIRGSVLLLWAHEFHHFGCDGLPGLRAFRAKRLRGDRDDHSPQAGSCDLFCPSSLRQYWKFAVEVRRTILATRPEVVAGTAMAQSPDRESSALVARLPELSAVTWGLGRSGWSRGKRTTTTGSSSRAIPTSKQFAQPRKSEPKSCSCSKSAAGGRERAEPARGTSTARYVCGLASRC